VMLLVIQ